LTGHDHARPTKPEFGWDDRAVRDDLGSELVADALALLALLALLARIDTTALTEKRQETVALLALVTGHDVEPADGWDSTDGRWKIVVLIDVTEVSPPHDHA